VSLAAEEVLRPGVPHAASRGDAMTSWRLPVYAACTALALLCNLLAGKEMAWDMLNYHFYAGFSALHDRFAQDYFAAGAQSYFNPYAYLPFYVLVRSGLSALAVASALAIAHSMMLWLSFEVGMLVAPSANPRTRLAVGLCSAAFALINPVLVQQIGSSFADVTTGTLALGGWLALVHAIQQPRSRHVLLGGLLLGAACALKPTNAVHAISAAVVLVMLPVPLATRARYTLRYGVSVVASFAIICAPWSYRLQRNFGNPVFPLLNNVFRSSQFTTEPLRHFRFIPNSLTEALWRPFAIVSPGAMVHEELSAPDLRYAVLILLTAAVLLHTWLGGAQRTAPTPAAHDDGGARIAMGLGLGLCVDWTLWLYGSGNARYFLPMACIAGTLVIALIFRLQVPPKARNWLLASILAAQSFQVWEGSDYRWNEAAWGGPWFRVDMPSRLAAEANLFLSIGVQSNSFLAPYVARGSGLVNFSGGYALGAEGETGQRIQALMHSHAPHLRMLATGAHVYDDSEGRGPSRSQIDGALRRLGLRVDPSDCETITVRGLPAELEFTIGKHSVPLLRSDNTSYVVSCRVMADGRDARAFMAEERAADVVLDRVEDACPLLFKPRRTSTEHPGTIWLRDYLDTDVLLWIAHGEVEFRDLIRGQGEVGRLGHAVDWARAAQPLRCERRDGRYYARPVAPDDPADANRS
jgi:hypothetical protein